MRYIIHAFVNVCDCVYLTTSLSPSATPASLGQQIVLTLFHVALFIRIASVNTRVTRRKAEKSVLQN